MFGHLDLSNDGILSTQELYDLEHDQVEVGTIYREYILMFCIFCVFCVLCNILRFR